MPETITIDTSRLETMISDLTDALGKDAAEVIRDETRLLVKEIVKLTPPQTKQIGEAAISGDLQSLFSGAHQSLIDDVGSAHGIRNVDTYVTGKDGNKIHLLWDAIDPMGAHMDEAHNRARGKNGRVYRSKKQSVAGQWRARTVVPFESKAAYLKKELAKVGRWKASWAATAMALGVANVVGWIKRHISGDQTPAGFHDTSGLMDGTYPKVMFGSRAPGVGRQRSIIQDAVRIRSEAIKKHIELVWSNYAKDKARGMRISSREKRSGQGGRYVIS